MFWKTDIHREKLRNQPDYVNIAELVRLEEERIELKQKNGEHIKQNIVFKILNTVFARNSSKSIKRSRYIKFAVFGGWFTGMHRFYAGQIFTGVLYLLFFWTGIPFAMTIMDLMAVLPMQADREGMLHL